MTDPEKSYTYEGAGVSIAAGNALVKAIGPLVRATARPGADAELGGFGAFFDPKAAGFKDPLLVAANDGVGTKLKLAIDHDRHDTVGVDLVAMCVNDLIVQGAEPLFFLDYFATGRLESGVAERVIAGIADGCRQAGCALIGGETAEMPGMYEEGDYDLAGFCVGVVEKANIIDGSKVAAGDALIALPSSGPPSNGYSLIRKIIEVSGSNLRQEIEGKTLASALMEPTRIYVKPVLELIKQCEVHAMAHITGGGLQENIPRVLPEGTRAVIDTNSWTRPAVFDWLQEQGNIEHEELHRTFNCGVGMVIALAESEVEKALAILQENGEAAFRIGTIEASDSGPRVLL